MNATSIIGAIADVHPDGMDNPDGEPQILTDHEPERVLESTPVASQHADLRFRGVAADPLQPTESQTVSLTGFFSDEDDQDSHSVTVDWGDGTMTAASINHRFNIFFAEHEYRDDNPTGTPQDDYTITATLEASDGRTATRDIPIVVSNVAPRITTLRADPQELDEGQAVTVTGFFRDPGLDDTHEVTIDWGDGSPTTQTTANPLFGDLYSFSDTHTYRDDIPSGVDFADYTITATVTDDDTGLDSATADVRVNNVAPRITAISADPQELNEGQAVTVTGFFRDPGLDDTHEVDIDWGDGSPITQATANPVFGDLYSFTETHTYLDDIPSGIDFADYTITATVTDDDTGIDSETADVRVNNVNPMITDLRVAPQPGLEGHSVTLSGDFIDPGLIDEHSVEIDWGDGNNSAFDVDALARSFMIDHTYIDDGTFEITVRLIDDDTGFDEEVVDAVIENDTPVVTSFVVEPTVIDENESVMARGTFADSGVLDIHVVEIDWGDGNSSFAMVDQTARSFMATHTYLDDLPSGMSEATYSVVATVRDESSESDSMPRTVNVHNVAPVITSITLPASINENDIAELEIEFTDPGTLDEHELIVDWGDGDITMHQVAVGEREIAVEHRYLDDQPSGAYTVTITLNDDDTGTDQAVRMIDVFNVDPGIANLMVPENVFEANEFMISGEVTDVGTLDTHTVVIAWEDGVETTIAVTPGNREFTATHTYPDDNPTGTPADLYPIEITITDDDGGVHVENTETTVNNVRPEFVAFDVRPRVIDQTASVTLSAEFTDEGMQDTHTADIIWGDGRETNDIPVLAGVPFTVDHTYFLPGTFEAVLVVTDDDTGTAEDSVFIRVNRIIFESEPIFFVPETIEAPERPENDDAAIVVDESVQPTAQLSTATELRRHTTTRVVEQRQVVLHVLKPDGTLDHEEVLKEEVLDRVTEFLRRLPDGHYRIYLREDGAQRLIIDAFVRDGQLVDPETASSGNDGQAALPVLENPVGLTSGRLDWNESSDTDTPVRHPVITGFEESPRSAADSDSDPSRERPTVTRRPSPQESAASTTTWQEQANMPANLHWRIRRAFTELATRS